MAKIIKALSVFFPAYNEEGNIEKVVESAKKVLEEVADKWEIIIVDDGSKDGTGAIADSLAGEDKCIRAIHHKRNCGYGASLKSGFYNAKYPWIAFTDADGQFDFREITRFIEAQKKENANLVIGYYLSRKVPFYRKLNSFLWELTVYLLFGLKVSDIDCGFKLISKRVIDEIPKLESERGAFISSELLIKANKKKFKIVEIGVHHYPRKLGRGTGSNLDVIVKSFIDLYKLWRELR